MMTKRSTASYILPSTKIHKLEQIISDIIKLVLKAESLAEGCQKSQKERSLFKLFQGVIAS